MKCPHCLVEVNETWSRSILGQDAVADWVMATMTCPNGECKKLIVVLLKGRRGVYISNKMHGSYLLESRIVHPIASGRPPISPDVPVDSAEDYLEACLVFAFSPKASAALSRRCLQHLLRTKAGVKKGDLANEIQQVLDSKQLPSHLSEALDAIRNIGNFATHPIKSQSSGEIVNVEPGEAEWLLDVLEGLFDFYFVQPAITKRKREALDQKLQDTGKPPMKA